MSQAEALTSSDNTYGARWGVQGRGREEGGAMGERERETGVRSKEEAHGSGDKDGYGSRGGGYGIRVRSFF
jgi:hypothetical protein